MRRKRRAKLSKIEEHQNETNKWLAKRDAAIAMLVKSMGHLVRLDRTGRRLQKAALHPVQQDIADKLNKATKRKRLLPELGTILQGNPAPATAPIEPPPAADPPPDNEARMKAAGFRPRKKARRIAATQSDGLDTNQ